MDSKELRDFLKVARSIDENAQVIDKSLAEIKHLVAKDAIARQIIQTPSILRGGRGLMPWSAQFDIDSTELHKMIEELKAESQKLYEAFRA